MTEHTVYEDQWGSIVDHPAEGILEIRWLESTAGMKKSEFNDWMTQYATQVERTGRKLGLVDAVSFQMDSENMDGKWRDENIIPRYNKAGMRGFAFLLPEGMPMIGETPSPEEPGRFPTGYFGTRDDAVAWLASKASRLGWAR